MSTIRYKDSNGVRVKIKGVKKPRTPTPPPGPVARAVGQAIGWLFLGIMIASLLVEVLG